ncbi:MAG: M48 family metalloprotease, partial [Duncaniella sp.]|nr:M48 family metalloprotease [Duncaniella sp.]
KYSQKQEKEADNCGYDFLVANGRNPWGMVMSYEKILELEGASGSQSSYFQKMFSSHPDTKSRIEAMTKRCNKDGYQRPEKPAKAETK